MSINRGPTMTCRLVSFLNSTSGKSLNSVFNNLFVIGSNKLCLEIQQLKPLRAVFGNIDDIDVRSNYPENLFFTCEDLSVFITHIGGYPGKYPAKIKSELLKIPSSITVGKQYISKYLTKINKMLSTELVNTEILDEIKREIKTDLKVIQADTALRGYVSNARENEKTMLLISNFIISL
mgnify:CR=1 FL=1